MPSDIVERLREVQHNILADMTRDAADEIDRLRADLAAAIKQRDEARRMWCRIISLQRRGARENFFPEDIAVEYGWDCYSAKEGGGA